MRLRWETLVTYHHTQLWVAVLREPCGLRSSSDELEVRKICQDAL